ncbi:hypothetical protein TD95_004327 [Thielaviopsis punctulata]|uniref:Uncharacterized protein n=1 Tax=Thielaviopsis punctulata TaxID=72032 RepID=A0A0F4ZJF4_9PEZI|nr:hypothetical protein TD95_004327 [Thielaviopsis punctulata]
MAQRRNNPFIRAGSPATSASTPSTSSSSPLASGLANTTTPSAALPSTTSATPSTPAAPSASQSLDTPTAGASKSRPTSVSFGASFGSPLVPANSVARHTRTESRNTPPMSNTFAPSFIHSDELKRTEEEIVDKIEGENDFSGKRYMWLKDTANAFVKGWVVEELEGNRILVQCEDGTQREAATDQVDKVNPAKFDKAGDMAELTHLNEASVVHNLNMRYQSDMIYTYSGLFLVTVNPYHPLPIYTNEYINMYKGRNREDTKPHIFAMADLAFRNLVEEGLNQSILVTGESGAGKTENTKKVIQYLAAVARTDSSTKGRVQQHSNLSEKILRANPILEAFGNAQTVRNNNSSRFGKFIRIEFSRVGAITGAFIDWYLLEKSRVVRVNSQERNYHIFYQLLKGADRSMRQDFLLGDLDVQDFNYTRFGQDTITGVSDKDEWNALLDAFNVMAFSKEDQTSILRTIAAVLHLGNIEVVKESRSADQARLATDAKDQATKVCKLLGVPLDPFLQGLLHPRVKAGREWVEKVQTPEQVRLALDALAKGIYERGFGDLVNRINEQLDRSGLGMGTIEDSNFIGVLDIAGFEIFEKNSFEQLCINYTNEKLQQFFNHHMFVLEQEEYAREKIEWQFIDFGRDLQPTIDLIELPNPIGIFSCLDEDCVMPKATDKSFTEKLNSLWDKKSTKYKPSRLGQGFILTHYAAEVEYSTEGWLEKNKDPLNDNITRLLAASTEKHIANLFSDCAELLEDANGVTAQRSRVKKGLFRTVAQRHKEQLHSLMGQLQLTHPHFVRCILPNHKKRPKQFVNLLVLDQLRCNGVLEGIRIARTGFPNRLHFNEFRQRYEVLCRDMPKGYNDGQAVAALMLDKLGLDKSLFRVGITKVFFRAGVLAELEEKRDALITEIVSRFQSAARGYIQRRIAYKRLFRTEATRIVQNNFRVYLELANNPWWQMLLKMKPLLGATRTAAEVKKRDEMIKQLSDKMALEAENRQKLEDERRNTHTELVRIKKTLESERALALDKEEIFKRLQNREAELEEKLSGALEDQDRLEEQLDAILAAKKQAEAEVDKFSTQLEQAATLIARLEEEKKKLHHKVEELDESIVEITKRQSERSKQEEALADEIKMLQSQLSLKERKVKDLETKMLKNAQDLEVELHSTQKELQTSKGKEQKLAREAKEMQRQLAQLSQTSTDYEDLVRKKESELSVLRSDKRKLETEKKLYDDERKSLAIDKEATATRLRDVQAELVALKSQHSSLQREAQDAKKLLEARLSEDAQADKNRQLLEAQIKSLKDDLYKTQMELSRERQSRDDVLLLGEHKYKQLKDEYDHLNESKIIIEKEMYVQQDILRRATEARATAEKERDEARDEIRKLRAAKAQAEEARLMAEEAGERQAREMARAREESLRKDLEAAQERLSWFEADCTKLNHQIEELNKLIIESGEFGLKNDQAKERLERELHTVKSRLTASENDNRALINKLQQKSLEIARSSSRASEANRSQVAMLTKEKRRIEEQNTSLNKQLNESQIGVTTLKKKVEKLELSVEDLNHELAREAKATRAAEKASSSSTAELAESKRVIESEKQLRTQAQSKVRTLQATLDSRDKELQDLRAQMLDVLRIVDPDTEIPVVESTNKESKDAANKAMLENFNLIRKTEELQQNLRIQTAARTNAESQLAELRAKQGVAPVEAPHTRFDNLADALNGLSPAGSRTSGAKANGAARDLFSSSPRKSSSLGSDALDSHDKPAGDAHGLNNRQDLKAEVQELQSKLQLALMQNRHLQSQLDRTPGAETGAGSGAGSGSGSGTESPTHQRMLKLEAANSRLHSLLDDSAKKVSVLEKSVRSGELSLRDLQTRSHEEILQALNSQEESRRLLLHSHKDAVAELAEVKSSFEKMRHERAALEVDVRDARSDLQEMTLAREQEAASRSQLLQEFADLQIRLDAETSKLAEVTSSMNLYKGRADEYFSKLEQAEIAVLKASRAEQFARAQSKEAEDTCAEVMAERKKMDASLEDLQRQNRRLEERLEDASTDLEAALQSKKRLQHELEDYRNQRAIDIEDKESSMEQTRKKYQTEFATLTKELDLAREEKLFKQAEIARLREELDELRSKWDDEVLNSSTWSKEKARLESTLADVASSRDEAVNAHNDAQGKIVTLLSQVRSLRTSVDEVSAERDALAREKRGLETRLAEAKAGLDSLASSEATGASIRDAASADKLILELKSDVAQKEDLATAAIEKMRRAEALATEAQKDAAVERDMSARLAEEKASVEKKLREVQVKLVDLETQGFKSASGDIKFLHKRIQELESQLEAKDEARSREARSVRNVDRVVKDLQDQIDRKEKQNAQLEDDVARVNDRVDKLLKTIDELQASESASQLTARRAERELRESREKLLMMEREVEAVKGGAYAGGSAAGGYARGSFRRHTGSAFSRLAEDEYETSLSREPSLTKGFI